MKTNEFIAELRAEPNDQLIFADLEGHAVHRGYHLTELKAATFDTVDCGGQTSQWQETIVQLWVPTNADDDYKRSAKFLKIFHQGPRKITVNSECGISSQIRQKKFLSIDISRPLSHARPRYDLGVARATCDDMQSA